MQMYFINFKLFRHHTFTYPFWIPALGSFDDLTPTIINAKSTKKHVRIKQILYTARYPTASLQSNTIDDGNMFSVVLELFLQKGT